MRRIVLFAALFLILFQVKAELKLPKVFADHMVLQRGQEIPVWGEADPRQWVNVTFQGKNTEQKLTRKASGC